LIKAKKLPVILDTSALLYPFQEGVDFARGISEGLEVPYELVVTQGTIEELRRLAGGRRHFLARASRKALKFIKGLRQFPTEGNLPEDEEIVSLAKELDDAVATADSVLRRKLRKMGLTVIFVSKGKRIRIDNKPLW